MAKYYFIKTNDEIPMWLNHYSATHWLRADITTAKLYTEQDKDFVLDIITSSQKNHPTESNPLYGKDFIVVPVTIEETAVQIIYSNTQENRLNSCSIY